jgi:tryptophan-rich sensory protein
MSLGSALISLAICALAAAFEGAMAGNGVKLRLAELRMPKGSPGFAVWIAIGVLYYAICFVVLYRLLAGGLARPLATAAFALTLLVLVGNAAWNGLFFRRKDLKASFLSFLPYGALVLGWLLCLLRADPWAALALVPYMAYLPYATWWGYRVWRLNS